MKSERDIMALLDDSYILEAEPVQRKQRKRKHRFSVAAAALAACLGMTAITAGAVTIMNRNSTEFFYDSQAEEILESKGLMVSETQTSKHFEITLDTVLADDYVCRAMLTARPLDDTAKSFVEACLDNNYGRVFEVCTKDGDGNRIFSSDLSYPDSNGDVVIVVESAFDYYFNQSKASEGIELTFTGPMVSGLSFKYYPKKNLESKTVKYSDDITFYVSPIELATVGTSEEAVDKVGFRASTFMWKEGGLDRFLESVGISREEYDKQMKRNKWFEFSLIMLGKYWNAEKKTSLGGSGIGFYPEGHMELMPEGYTGFVGEGSFVRVFWFGALIDLDDIEGIIYGLEEIPF